MFTYTPDLSAFLEGDYKKVDIIKKEHMWEVAILIHLHINGLISVMFFLLTSTMINRLRGRGPKSPKVFLMH